MKITDGVLITIIIACLVAGIGYAIDKGAENSANYHTLVTITSK